MNDKYFKAGMEMADAIADMLGLPKAYDDEPVCERCQDAFGYPNTDLEMVLCRDCEERAIEKAEEDEREDKGLQWWREMK